MEQNALEKCFFGSVNKNPANPPPPPCFSAELQYLKKVLPPIDNLPCDL